MSDPNSWYITASGREQGPFNPQQLRQLAVEQKLRPDMTVRRGDQTAGVPASAIRGLFTIEELQAWTQQPYVVAQATAKPAAAPAPGAARSPSQPVTSRASRSDSRPAGSARIKATAAANHPSGLLVPPPPGSSIGGPALVPAVTPAPIRPSASVPAPVTPAAPPAPEIAPAPVLEVGPENIALEPIALPTAAAAMRPSRTTRSPSRANASSRRRGAVSKDKNGKNPEPEGEEGAPPRRKKKRGVPWPLYVVAGVMACALIYLGLHATGILKPEPLSAVGTWRLDTTGFDKSNEDMAVSGPADQKPVAQARSFLSDRILRRARLVIDQDHISLPVGGRIVRVEYKPAEMAMNALELRLISTSNLPEKLQFTGSLALVFTFPKDGSRETAQLRFKPDTYLKRFQRQLGLEAFDVVRESRDTAEPAKLDDADLQKFVADLARIYDAPSATSAAPR